VKVKGVGGVGDPAAQWGMRLVKEKEMLSSDEKKLRLMMDFLATPQKRPRKPASSHKWGFPINWAFQSFTRAWIDPIRQFFGSMLAKRNGSSMIPF
jgi:hypothetical protein